MGIGAWSKRVGISGLTYASMRKHYAITPIFGFAAICVGGGLGYILRLATRHPEVQWTRGNPEPWEEYRQKQYKFLAVGRDYSIPSPAPIYK